MSEGFTTILTDWYTLDNDLLNIGRDVCIHEHSLAYDPIRRTKPETDVPLKMRSYNTPDADLQQADDSDSDSDPTAADLLDEQEKVEGTLSNVSQDDDKPTMKASKSEDKKLAKKPIFSVGTSHTVVSVLPRVPELCLSFGEDSPSNVIPFRLDDVLKGDEDKAQPWDVDVPLLQGIRPFRLTEYATLQPDFTELDAGEFMLIAFTIGGYRI
ncbi:hypothetical protein ARMGADRAFT_1081999 [Armillaria gallica]|uniref:Uncharacterized protein n=1 Tax=Armillaria gallica TaxID=47427 RepID=A0A2H3D7K7_ARMGA|nr:hypothetical protein ARMGADRAFT_1081999 [Armillaria gallica]